jgi:hypothetical protein
MVTKELIDYIQKLSPKYSEEQIRQSLLKAGWKEEDITQGFLQARPKKSFFSFSLKKLAVLGIFLILAIVSALITFNMRDQRMQNRDNLRQKTVNIIQSSLSKYYKDKGIYPMTLDQLNPLYLTDKPVDPKTNLPFEYAVADNGKTYTVCTLFENQPRRCFTP